MPFVPPPAPPPTASSPSLKPIPSSMPCPESLEHGILKIVLLVIAPRTSRQVTALTYKPIPSPVFPVFLLVLASDTVPVGFPLLNPES